MSTTPSNPLKSSMLRVYRGRPAERAVAAIKRSIARLPRALRPPLVTAAKTLPYARAAAVSNGRASKVAWTRCRRSCLAARSFASRVAWTPAISSASVMAATLASSGNADSGGGSIRTDVSTIPRARRGSGTRSRILIDQFVNIASEPGWIDSRGPGERFQQHPSRHRFTAPDGHELPDGHAVARDDVRLASVETAHDFAALIPKRPLGDDLSHEGSVARVRRPSKNRPVCRKRGIASRRLLEPKAIDCPRRARSSRRNYGPPEVAWARTAAARRS